MRPQISCTETQPLLYKMASEGTQKLAQLEKKLLTRLFFLPDISANSSILYLHTIGKARGERKQEKFNFSEGQERTAGR